MTPFFHVGLAVLDLEAAMAELGDTLGMRWAPIQEARHGEWPIRVTYGLDGPPYIELIEGTGDGPWSRAEGSSAVHHLGAWSPDLDDDVARVAELGLPIEVDGRAIGGPWTYVMGASSGVRIEFLDAGIRASFKRLWGLDDPGPVREHPDH